MYVKIYNDDNECIDIINPEISGPFSSEQEERDWVEEGTMQAIGEAFSSGEVRPTTAFTGLAIAAEPESTSKSEQSITAPAGWHWADLERPERVFTMDEKTAYQWAAGCLGPIEKLVEPHKLQQVADKIASALLASA